MEKNSFTKLILFGISFFAPGIFCQNCKEKRVSQIKMNEVQVIGSHNSYKKEIQPELLEFLRKENNETALALDYQHVSIPQQSDFGLRNLELDVVNEQREKQETYLQGHPSLQGRVMFVNAKPGTDAAAFVILNDPVTYQDSISSLVKKGYIVRTRADADTREARLNDYRRFKAAMASGAQIISTDYYLPDKRLDNDYHIKFPGDVMSHYNPVLLPDSIPVKIPDEVLILPR